MYLQYTPSSKRNLSSKIIDKSETVYFFSCFLREYICRPIFPNERILLFLRTFMHQMHETDDKTETIKIIKLCGKGFKPYILQSPLRC